MILILGTTSPEAAQAASVAGVLQLAFPGDPVRQPALTQALKHLPGAGLSPGSTRAARTHVSSALSVTHRQTQRRQVSTAWQPA